MLYSLPLIKITGPVLQMWKLCLALACFSSYIHSLVWFLPTIGSQVPEHLTRSYWCLSVITDSFFHLQQRSQCLETKLHFCPCVVWTFQELYFVFQPCWNTFFKIYFVCIACSSGCHVAFFIVSKHTFVLRDWITLYFQILGDMLKLGLEN